MTDGLYEQQDLESIYDDDYVLPQPHRVSSIIAHGGRWLNPAEQLPTAKPEIVITLPDALQAQVSVSSDAEKTNLAKFLARLSTE